MFLNHSHFVHCLERKKEATKDKQQNVIDGNSEIKNLSGSKVLVTTFVKKFVTSDKTQEDINIGKNNSKGSYQLGWTDYYLIIVLLNIILYQINSFFHVRKEYRVAFLCSLTDNR